MFKDDCWRTFTSLLYDEHRAIDRSLAGLADAWQARDWLRVRIRMDLVLRLAGPHFRSEEHAFVAAQDVMTKDLRVNQLLDTHDAFIATVGQLHELLAYEPLRPASARHAQQLVSSALQWVHACDDFSPLVKQLPLDRVMAAMEVREQVAAGPPDLLDWAQHARGRPVLPTAR